MTPAQTSATGSTSGSETATGDPFGQPDRSCRKNARDDIVPDFEEKEARGRPRRAKADAGEDVREVVDLEVEAAEADDPHKDHERERGSEAHERG